MTSDTTIITVAYNSNAVLEGMLDSIPTFVPVIIVDNAAQEPVTVSAERENVTIITNPVNLGFGTACNIGAANAETDYLLFLNPDARLTEGALVDLKLAAQTYKEVSGFNPKMLNEAGEIFFKKANILLPELKRMKEPPFRDCEIPVLSGAALFISRKNFERLGGFDPNIFLFHEDDDLSARLVRQVGPLMHVEDALVMHTVGGSSTPSDSLNAFKAWHLARSRIYVLNKHDIGFGFAKTLAKALRNIFKPSTFSNPALRKERLAYLRGVLSTWSDGGINRESRRKR